jgi:uncharacterized protein YqeY
MSDEKLPGIEELSAEQRTEIAGTSLEEMEALAEQAFAEMSEKERTELIEAVVEGVAERSKDDRLRNLAARVGDAKPEIARDFGESLALLYILHCIKNDVALVQEFVEDRG